MDELETWPRPYYEPGGGRPFLFYAVFGARGTGLKVSRSRYRCAGIPAGIELHAYEQDDQAEVLDDFRSGYLWESLQEDDSGLAEEIAAQERCVVLRGELAEAPTLDAFRDVIGFVTCLLDNGGVAVYDPQGFKWWSAQEWREVAFDPGKPSPRQHVVILTSEEDDGTTWFHTRGMRKFGRPDLSIHEVGPDFEEAVIELFNRFIEFQAFGGVIAEGRQVRMGGLPEGMTCRHAGSEDDYDFNNVHVEVHWPDD